MLAIPISDYPANKNPLDDSTFNSYPPYWYSKYEVSFVNLPTLIDYVESLRTNQEFDNIFSAPGIVAEYVVYNENNLHLMFDPLNVSPDHEGDFKWDPVDG